MESLVIELRLNDQELDVTTVEELGTALDVADADEAFELWASVPTGPAMSMLRNGSSAWLTYLREPGDSGFRSSGNESRQGVAAYRLSNGQVDEYPLAWCIDVEQCYMLGLAPQPRHNQDWRHSAIYGLSRTTAVRRATATLATAVIQT